MSVRGRAQPTSPSREAVLGAALELLQQGPEALTVRAIAGALHTSTQAIYTRYGGKNGLVSEIYREGYRRLRAALAQAGAQAGGHEERLKAMGRAYRDFALANTELFQVMFCDVVPGFTPEPDTLEDTWRAFEVLLEAVRAAVAAGVWQGEPEAVARLLWQVVHGQSQLEVAGYLARGPEGEQQQRFAFDILARALAGGGQNGAV